MHLYRAVKLISINNKLTGLFKKSDTAKKRKVERYFSHSLMRTEQYIDTLQVCLPYILLFLAYTLFSAAVLYLNTSFFGADRFPESPSLFLIPLTSFAAIWVTCAIFSTFRGP